MSLSMLWIYKVSKKCLNGCYLRIRQFKISTKMWLKWKIGINSQKLQLRNFFILECLVCTRFLGSMLPQYIALSVSFVSFVSFVEKICVSVRWVTLWVRPPLLKICVSVCWVTLLVRPPL